MITSNRDRTSSRGGRLMRLDPLRVLCASNRRRMRPSPSSGARRQRPRRRPGARSNWCPPRLELMTLADTIPRAMLCSGWRWRAHQAANRVRR